MKYLFNLFNLLLSGSLFAQGVQYSHYYEDKAVNSIAIDGAGRPVFGTYFGVSRLDSSHWTHFEAYRTLNISTSVSAVTVDRQNQYWAANRDQLVKLNGASSESIPIPSVFYSEIIYNITLDAQNQVWIGTSAGLGRYDGRNWKVFNRTNSNIPDISIKAIAIDRQGVKWLGTPSGLVRWNDTTWTLFPNPGAVNTLIIAPDQTKWCGGAKLYQFKDTIWKTYTPPNSLQSIYAMSLDTSGFLITAHLRGLGIFKDSVWISGFDIPTPYTATTMVSDTQGNIYIGFGNSNTCCRNGYMKININNWQFESKKIPNSSLKSRITLLAVDSSNVLWASGAQKLFKFDGVSWDSLHVGNSGLIGNTVLSAAVDRQNHKWFGTTNGISKYDGANWTTFNAANTGFADNRVQTIAIDRLQNKWFSIGGELWKFNGVHWTVYNATNSPLTGFTLGAIHADIQNNIWVAASYGLQLYRFDGSNWTLFNSSNMQVASDRITGIASDPQGKVWVGLHLSGTASYDGTQWTRYYYTTTCLQSDGQKLFMGTVLDGLVSWDGQQFLDRYPMLWGWVQQVAFGKNGEKWFNTQAALIHWNGCSLNVVPQLAITQPVCNRNTGQIEILSLGDSTFRYWLNAGIRNGNRFESLYPSDYGLNIQDTLGCYQILNVRVANRVPNPTPNFTYTRVGNRRYQFQNGSTQIMRPVYHWDFGDGQTSNLENPVVTYAQTGRYTIKLSVVNDSLCERNSSQTILEVPTTEITPLQWRVYPNPVSHVLNVEVSLPVKALIINSLGQMVLSLNLVEGANQIALNDLPAGSYYLKSPFFKTKLVRL